MKNNFECSECKTEIKFNKHGSITECEHHPFTKLAVIHYRQDFQYVLAVYVRTENPVTQHSLLEILIKRLENNDIHD